MCLVVKAVESVCGDHRRKVKAAVLSFIKELFRSGVDDCSAWGLVAYIFQEFSRATSRLETGNLSEIEVLEETALQTLCLQVLDSLDVSVSGMARLLWPRLLQYVVPAQYTGTLIPLSRCLRALLERQERAEEQKEEPNYLGYQEHATMPTPQALLLRLLLLACSPYGGGGRGVAALQLLQALRRQIHRAVGIPWMVQIPSLLQYLEGKDESSLDYAEWECLLLKLLRTSLESIGNEAWISLELTQQLAKYPRLSKEKSFLYKAVGTALAASQNVSYVREQMQSYLEGINWSEPSEREGPLSVLACCAESHLDLALRAVQEFDVAGQKRTFSRALTFREEQQKEKRGKACAAVMLAFSRIALHAPKRLLCSRVETVIVENILCQYRSSSQDSELKLALIQSVTEVSSAIQGVSNEENFHFSSKRVLLELLLDLVKQEPVGSVPSPVCCKAILALEHLSKIKPSLTQEENCHLLHACFQSLFPLPPLERTREEGEAAKDTQHGESLYRQSLGALGQLVASLEEGLTSSWLKETFHLLEAWLHSEKEWERERALQVCTQLTKAYAERSVDAGESTCAQLGSLIAVLGPLSCDSLVTSRQWAVDCVSCLLSTQGEAMHMKKEEVKHFREELSATDVDSLLKTSSQIAKVVCQAFPSEQVRDFLKAVLGSMLSFSPTCARAAGHWMLIFLEQRGREILPEVLEVLSVIYDHLPACQQDYLKEFLLHAVSVLACYHPEAVTNSLLQRRLPMDRFAKSLGC
ncbi:maestro heat-like repeat-containing protein family member 2B [Struthio camelus]|uniref:maestro heat-like repeat-containing protein family member 2B n=1 Tax=Struthio camelus TaxID=8801 RepID=UPI003603DD73